MSTAVAEPWRPSGGLRWQVDPGKDAARLMGDWTALGESRPVVPVHELATLLGAESAAVLAARLSAPGSWVFFARRLRERRTAFADVLVQANVCEGAISGTVADLTEKLGQARTGAAVDGEQLLNFAQRLTHDLRIPLRQVHDCLAQLRIAHQQREDGQQWLHYAESSLARARAVVNDAFELMQVISGKRALHLEAMRLSVVVPALSNLHQPSVVAAGQTLEVFTEEDAFALVDFAALSVVMDNLLSNAVRHNPAGTRIQVVARRDDNGAPLVTVSDTGNSLSDDHFARLFEPFFRAQPQTVGSGLGMLLVLELCRLMEASVLLRRNADGGLVVELRFAQGGQHM